MAEEQTTQTPKKEPITINNANSVIGWLDSFLKLVKQYGVSKIIIGTLLLSIICIFFYFIFNPTAAFEFYDNWKESQHNELIEQRLETSPKMQSVVDKLTMKVDAARTLIIELHNGNTSNSGLPFFRGTATYEGLNIGVMPIAGQYENQSLSLIPFASYLFQYGFWQGNTDDMKEIDRGLYYKMKSNGTEHFAAGLIMGIDRPLAFMFVSFDHLPDENHDCADVRRNMQHVAMEVAVLLEVEKRTADFNKENRKHREKAQEIETQTRGIAQFQ